MNKKTKKTILISTSIFALCASLFAAFGSNFDLNKIMNARASDRYVYNGCAEFDCRDTVITGSSHNYTYTTDSTTYLGYPIRCSGVFDSSQTYAVAYYSTANRNCELAFYDTTLGGEFVFQKLKKAYFDLSYADRTLVLKFTTTESSEPISVNFYMGNNSGYYDFEAHGYEVETLRIGYPSDSGYTKVNKISGIQLYYDCGGPTVKTLDSLTITSAPSKTSYDTGDVFDKTGMSLRANYSDGSTKDVTSLCVFPTNALKSSDTSVAISYTYRGVTKTAYQSITVTDVPVTGVTLNESSATINTGEELVLTPTISPSNATNKNVTWSSSDTSVATVSNGTVTGVGEGTATITVTTEDGNFEASCVVTVQAGVVYDLYYLADGSAYYTVALYTDGSGYYRCDYPSFTDYNSQQHFTYSVSNTKITFTINFIQDEDYWNTGGYYALFTNSAFASYNTTNTGTLSGSNLTIYRCNTSARTSTAKTLVKQ